MNTRTLLGALLLSGLCAVAQAGDIYKWVDAKGRFHYSDVAQAGWTRVDDKTGTARASSEDSDGENREGDEEQASTAAARRAADCARAQEQLRTYRSATRIVERDSLGREKEYSDEDREKLLVVTEQQIASNCQERAPQ
jgi:opacity protein-like surface antigen